MSGVTTTTTTTTSTTTTTTTTEAPTESNDTFLYQRCYESILTESQYDIVKYLMYFCAGWIIFWCIITILVNLCHRNSGHHRFIHFYEELSIILLAVAMFVLNFLFMEKPNVCKFISIFIHFFMCLTAAIFLAEAFFASSMVHGKADKNGNIPWIIYYTFPILIAAGPTMGTYLPEKQYYGTSSLHCFADSTVDMFWGFVIPVWVLLTLTGLKAQLACIACDRQQDSQDIKQCYWARRSVKSLGLISHYLFSIWLMVMLSAEHQKLYLFIVTTCMVLIFGPALFVCHTYCHMNTCQKWGGSGCFGSLYAMCPPKKAPKNDSSDDEEEKKTPEKEKEPETVKPKEEEKPTQNTANYPNQTSENPQYPTSKAKDFTKIPTKHTNAQNFYSWLTDASGNGRSGDILFGPAIA